jgi:hypothetical protein
MDIEGKIATLEEKKRNFKKNKPSQSYILESVNAKDGRNVLILKVLHVHPSISSTHIDM